MKTYVGLTSALFFLLGVVHIVRMYQERNLMQDPWYIGITMLSFALGLWALRLFMKARTPTAPSA